MPDPETIYLYTRNDQTLLIKGVINQAGSPPAYIDNGTITGNVYDAHDNLVAGATNLTLAYVPFSNGDYSCQIDGDQFQPDPGGGYYATFELDIGNDLNVFWLERPVIILERSS
jgi:hypothetical protein